MIPTPHNECKDASLIAKTVLMPGDPLRAEYIANTYLTDVVKFTSVRNVYGFTGYYNKKRISVMASGMGQPSIGIYSYELYNDYGVENIIRIGSAGAYDPNLAVFDTVLATKAYSESNYAKVAFGMGSHYQSPSKKLNNKLTKAANKLGIELKNTVVHSSDVFYSTNPNRWQEVRDKFGCGCVEMESFALFANAKVLGKNAACLLTISDSFITHEVTTSYERQTAFNNMIKIALELASNK